MRERLSPEQRTQFQVHSVMLSVILLAFLFGTLCFSGLVMFCQFAIESRNEYKVRRLRWHRNGQQVQPPRIGAGEFHVFLSHQWESGQDQSTHAAPQTTD